MTAVSLDEYLAQAAPGRRDDLERLHRLIRAEAPELDLEVTPGLLGYGPFHYRYASGREGDSHLISLADRKRYISLYVNCATDGGYLAEQFAARLPKANVGRSCIRFRRLDDIDVDVLADLVRAAALEGPPASGDA
jgi:hypothetical protein